MKKTLSAIAAAFICLSAFCQGFCGGQPGHVQGLAWDASAHRMYYSFTTRFVATDSLGNVVGSIDRIHGHLGAMTFDPDSRKVYASLECKDDEIGSSISKKLGEDTYKQSRFYIAEIDVDDFSLKQYEVRPAADDYRSGHFGCSGIDGVTIGPGFKGQKGRFLYVAYGIYSDTTRTDNDNQIILQYRLGDFSKPEGRYYVRTGNTTYGVQNLAYDPFTNMMFLAVYRGKKSCWPNYDLFAVSMDSVPRKSLLEGVPYQRTKVWTIPVAGGWHFPLGSYGLCPLGDGRWYFAKAGRDEADGSGSRTHNCTVVTCIWQGAQNETPFIQ